MAITSHESEVERIVAEVVRRLGTILESTLPPQNVSDQNVTSASAAEFGSTASAPATVDPTRLKLRESVITTKSLEGQLVGRTAIVVSKKAVVTPAARDVLRSAGVSIVREEISSAGSARLSCSESPTARLLLINGAQDVDHQGIVSSLRTVNYRVDSSWEPDIANAVRKFDRQLKTPHDLGAFICREPDRALILTNRSRRLRAIQAADRKRLTESMRVTGANVLILDPQGQSEQSMLKSLQLFLQEMPRQIPPEMR